MKNVELSIPDMQSTHCQTRVNAVVNEFEDVKIGSWKTYCFN